MAETVRPNPLKEEIGTPEIAKPRVQEIKERCNWGGLKAVTAPTELFSLYSSASLSPWELEVRPEALALPGESRSIT